MMARVAKHWDDADIGDVIHVDGKVFTVMGRTGQPPAERIYGVRDYRLLLCDENGKPSAVRAILREDVIEDAVTSAELANLMIASQ